MFYYATVKCKGYKGPKLEPELFPPYSKSWEYTWAKTLVVNYVLLAFLLNLPQTFGRKACSSFLSLSLCAIEYGSYSINQFGMINFSKKKKKSG